MTSFRLICCFGLLLVVCSVGLAETQPATISPTMVQLQQENVSLQRQVKRLEAQVEAMRDEMNTPGVVQIFSGIGYIVGLFGVAAWVAAGKKSGQGN